MSAVGAKRRSDSTEVRPSRPAVPGWLATRSGTELLEASALPILTVALIAFFSLLPATSTSFPTVSNLQITLGTQAVLVVVTMAALIPLMAGEYDFSVGANAGMGAIFAASLMSSGSPVPVALLVAAGIGGVVGVVNGLLVTKARVNSVVTTLGTATLISGVVGWKSGGKSIVENIPASLTDFMTRQLAGIPLSFLLALAVTFGVYYLLRHTPWGRYLDAIGVNKSASRLLSIKLEREVFLSFLISGVLAGAAGLLIVGQNGSASPAIGPGYTLPAIAAAFLSVAAIVPGRFNVWGSLVAIVFLAALNSGLTLAGASPFVNDFANGGALIVGVAMASLLGRQRVGME
jgi:ribose transport system permease protein